MQITLQYLRHKLCIDLRAPKTTLRWVFTLEKGLLNLKYYYCQRQTTLDRLKEYSQVYLLHACCMLSAWLLHDFCMISAWFLHAQSMLAAFLLQDCCVLAAGLLCACCILSACLLCACCLLLHACCVIAACLLCAFCVLSVCFLLACCMLASDGRLNHYAYRKHGVSNICILLRK